MEQRPDASNASWLACAGAIALAGLMVILFAGPALAQATLPGMPQLPAPKVAGPVITASGGAATFATACSSCHGAGATGGYGPALEGKTFWTQWEGKPLRRLYSVILSTMPMGNPGSLSAEQTLGIVAYLVKLRTGTAPKDYASAHTLNAIIVPPPSRN